MATKRSELERRALELVIERGDEGILQSDLWRALNSSSREGSRIALKLAKRGLVRREKELHEGRWTYRLILNRKPMEIDSILDVPCTVCPDSVKCEADSPVSPNLCTKLTAWLLSLVEERRDERE